MSDAWTRVSSEEDTLPDDLLVYLLCITYMELLIFIRYLPNQSTPSPLYNHGI